MNNFRKQIFNWKYYYVIFCNFWFSLQIIFSYPALFLSF